MPDWQAGGNLAGQTGVADFLCTSREARILARANLTEAEVVGWCIAYLRRTLDPSVVVADDVTFAAMGLAVLPEIAIESEVALGRLARLPFEPAITIETSVMWHRDKWLSPALAAFLALVEERWAPVPA